jgi:hypothetical protein
MKLKFSESEDTVDSPDISLGEDSTTESENNSEAEASGKPI